MTNKYGLFSGASDQPSQTIEGDEMHYCGNDTVIIYKKLNGMRREQIGLFRLQAGECVKIVGAHVTARSDEPAFGIVSPPSPNSWMNG